MRIISGKFKGKKILQPKDKETRPLKDLAKESIFNIINHSNKFKINIENSILKSEINQIKEKNLNFEKELNKLKTTIENKDMEIESTNFY